MHFEVQVWKLEGLECLEFAADFHRHVPAGRVTVGEIEDNHGPAVVGTDLRHLIDQGVGQAASRQVEICLVAFSDRRQHRLK